MKAAAIDLGTNAFRCLIRDIDSNNNNEIRTFGESKNQNNNKFNSRRRNKKW